MSASAILKLQRVGFTSEQVEALAELIDTQAASKTDLEAAEHRLDTRIIETKAELKADIAELKAGQSDIRATLQAAMAQQELRLLRWVVGTGAASVLAIVGVIRYTLAGH